MLMGPPPEFLVCEKLGEWRVDLMVGSLGLFGREGSGFVFGTSEVSSLWVASSMFRTLRSKRDGP
jgi:hypothetical protein